MRPCPFRARREAGDNGTVTAPGPQHAARTHRATRIATAFFVVSLAVLVIGSAVAVTAALTSEEVVADAPLGATKIELPPASPSRIPVPTQTTVPVTDAPCELPAVADALASGDDEAVVQAFGGGTAVREAVVAGRAPCIDLADPTRQWIVVNKTRPLNPEDYEPPDIAAIAGSRDLGGGGVRNVAAAALTDLIAAARDDGVGEIAAASSYRSYSTQVQSYNSQVAQQGQDEADRSSARPGHSEHQTGFASDVVACDAGSCTGLDGLAGTPQGDWVAAHSWEYGWIVRYVEGQTEVTGYDPEPWHLRYVGPELARAYHDGNYTTLEAFWNLPAAPEYVE
jgi:zinc D-Ala-D-Ala carboxypeptidase